MRGGLLVKIRRELRDAESKAKGAKGGERSREQSKGSKGRGEKQRATTGFVFRNATLGLDLKNILLIYTCFFLSDGLVEPVRFGSIGFRL
jgi:hypothetical protein